MSRIEKVFGLFIGVVSSEIGPERTKELLDEAENIFPEESGPGGSPLKKCDFCGGQCLKRS